jgi:hypothetical protein
MVREPFVGLTENKPVYEEMSWWARLESSGSASNRSYAGRISDRNRSASLLLLQKVLSDLWS